jgi:hypothetical protein
MARGIQRRQASVAEIFGLVVGGGTLLAVLSAQVIFLMWMI